MSTISSSKYTENMHDVYRSNYYMKTFCEFLEELAIKIIDFFKNEFVNKQKAGIIWKGKNMP